MKKKLLFVIESLNLGGAEKSLTTLLNLLDFEKYDVDLQLFAYGGAFTELLPAQVTLLPELPYFAFCRGEKAPSGRRGRFARARFSYSVALRMKKTNNTSRACLLWKKTAKCFDPQPTEYDVAIAYAQGMPTFYVADKIRAKKKFAWVNVTYRPSGKYLKYVRDKQAAFDRIVCVSDETRTQVCAHFGYDNQRTTTVYDINSARVISRMAATGEAPELAAETTRLKLLTVGRLANQKGYDMAIDAAAVLRERGIDFVWYALGAGPLEAELREQIKSLNLEDRFLLLGTRSNPYPYFAGCDIYVQTSRFEGFGMTIAEARILEKPVVTTRFDTVFMQMKDRVNGLVVDMNAEGIAEGVMRFLYEPGLKQSVLEYLKTEKKGNEEELEKFCALIDGE